MVKSDFISNHLTTLPFNELISAIKTLEIQKNLIAELKFKNQTIFFSINS